MNNVKIIVTLGPATKKLEDLKKMKDRGVDFVRINMSHSSIEGLQYFIRLSKQVGIPFIIDTEGSQIRTGDHSQDSVELQENEEIRIYNQQTVGSQKEICMRPFTILKQLEPGDLLHIDFNALILRVSDISTLPQGYITAKAVTSGIIAKNKAVAVDPAAPKNFNLPPLSEKDYESIALGLKEGIGYIAASFMRSRAFVEAVRKATQGKMKIISKIECMDGLQNLTEIMDASDYLLIDRGDLSKEVPLDHIPFMQKIILSEAVKRNKEVFVATNLLETMSREKRPTRAEVHDVIITILDGAAGVALAAETAIGKHPLECINMINKLIKQAQLVTNRQDFLKADANLTEHLRSIGYITDDELSSVLVPPHGGKLVDRMLKTPLDKKYLDSLEKVNLDENLQMDVEQIALGTFSPIEGFMDKKDFQGVLNDMRLASGVVWTIPIILDIPTETASRISKGDDIALCDDEGIMAVMHVSDKFLFDKEETSIKLYGTASDEHPGVRWINEKNPVLIGGPIDLIRRRKSEYKEYELTPRQVRRLFEEKGWSRVVGFHTRNVRHRSHEFIQLKAMEEGNCDGLFVHPVIGKKKQGDFHAKYIIHSYEEMMKSFYPRNKVIFATYATFSRYAGPREAIFTALCRKNFGCSHFVVGRDHTGVGNFYHPHASHKIFDKFPDLGVIPIKFDTVFYSEKKKAHIHGPDAKNHDEADKLHISGTQARKMFEKGESPPSWFMRPEISKMITNSIKKGEEVFVK